MPPTTPAAPAAPAFVPRDLLAGDALSVLPGATAEELSRLLESQLLRLAACEARLDLQLGAGLAGVSMDDVHRLSHGSRESFAREQLGFTWSHARELIALHEKLPGLPLLWRAFLAGGIRRSRLREILRVATRENEAAWFGLARSLTMSALRARVAGTSADEASDDEPDRFSIACSAEDAVFIESIGLPRGPCWARRVRSTSSSTRWRPRSSRI